MFKNENIHKSRRFIIIYISLWGWIYVYVPLSIIKIFDVGNHHYTKKKTFDRYVVVYKRKLLKMVLTIYLDEIKLFMEQQIGRYLNKRVEEKKYITSLHILVQEGNS